MSIRGFVTSVCSFVLLAAPALAAAQSAKDQYVPVDSVPDSDKLPAAPLVIAAYAFVWIALMVYVWSIWRRLGKVEADLQSLERKRAK